jgi:hypothetical protein
LQIQPSRSATFGNVIEYCRGKPRFFALVVCFRDPFGFSFLDCSLLHSSEQNDFSVPINDSSNFPQCLHIALDSALINLAQKSTREQMALIRFCSRNRSCDNSFLQNASSSRKPKMPFSFFFFFLCSQQQSRQQYIPKQFPPAFRNLAEQFMQLCQS